MAPLTPLRATLDGEPTDSFVEYCKQRANPGGSLITEATFINRLSGGFPHGPGIYTQSQVDQWKKVVSAVHEKYEKEEGKSVIFLQVWHIGGAGTKFLNPNEEQVVGPSAIAIGGSSVLTDRPFEVPCALEIEDIQKLIEDHRQAVLNVIDAGFDGVEISSATGYLLDQFINSNSKQTHEPSWWNHCEYMSLCT